MKDVVTKEHMKSAVRFRELLAAYRDAEDLINLGGYVRGANPVVDKAIEMKADLDNFLKQGIYEQDTIDSIVLKMNEMFAERVTRRAEVRPAPAFAQVIR